MIDKTRRVSTQIMLTRRFLFILFCIMDKLHDGLFKVCKKTMVTIYLVWQALIYYCSLTIPKLHIYTDYKTVL